jgi:RimJ/RimL family protein N-acetyltransferase
MAITKNTEFFINDKKVVLRNGKKEDAEKLIELMKLLDKETTFLLREPDEFDLTLEQEEGFVESQLNSEVNLFLVAEVDGEIIGSCGINGSKRKRLRHSATLGVAIRKDYWCLGIGRKLMEKGIQWAQENGMSRITLHVDSENLRAINLYMKLGFEVEGILRNDKILGDGTVTNTYTMALLK